MSAPLPPQAFSDPEVLRLRDDIARETLQTFLKETDLFHHVSGGNCPPQPTPAEVADVCYGMAEAMIARRFGSAPPTAAEPHPVPEVAPVPYTLRSLGAGVKFRFPNDKRVYFYLGGGRYKQVGLAGAMPHRVEDVSAPIILVGD